MHKLTIRYSKNQLSQKEIELLQQAKSYEFGELNEEQLEIISGGWSSHDAATLAGFTARSIALPILAPFIAIDVGVEINEIRLN